MSLFGKSDKEVGVTTSGFEFSGIEIERLESSEYTLVCILVDASASVQSFEDELTGCIKEIVAACKKSPRSENLLIRIATFNASHSGNTNIEEIHGFLPLNEIDTSDYENKILPSGMTPLFDAAGEAIETIESYGKKLYEQDYTSNGIVFIITDGWENCSTKLNSALNIKDRISKVRMNEQLESLTSILIGVNLECDTVKQSLDDLKKDANIDCYVPLEDASSSTLAKLARFVSKSISATSTSLANGENEVTLEL